MGKNGPENRVYLFQSHTSGIKKSDNSLDLHIIKYGFNILTRVIVITLFFKYAILSLGKGIKSSFWGFFFGGAQNPPSNEKF